jgi:hypothetical protein
MLTPSSQFEVEIYVDALIRMISLCNSFNFYFRFYFYSVLQLARLHLLIIFVILCCHALSSFDFSNDTLPNHLCVKTDILFRCHCDVVYWSCHQCTVDLSVDDSDGHWGW